MTEYKVTYPGKPELKAYLKLMNALTSLLGKYPDPKSTERLNSKKEQLANMLAACGCKSDGSDANRAYYFPTKMMTNF